MRTVQKWTEIEKQKLVQLVKDNTKNNRTNWIYVSQQMNRTPNQCKQYHTIAIKQSVPKYCNAQWTNQRFLQLLSCVQIYDKKWSLIQKLQFPNYSPEQLRQKYYSFLKIKSIKNEQIIQIKQGNIQPQFGLVKELYEHFHDLKQQFDNCNNFDLLNKKALIKANDDLNLEELVGYLENVMKQY
ncbi:Myb-like_DNA-binding domain-containing protein [Hexamita inflata]|uniref:Myb-like DNA-binding domain-containing protein n=1 Tax=Hexamita inflata TaxID=28002 RepID=A0AA86TD92_9EUKA|nr:Myb-like DNA-binding domain-containing protein [Hexamita inflata]CAI9939187.1 Myb-like DNA-binding domain-containing protein [Hexamita inflata]